MVNDFPLALDYGGGLTLWGSHKNLANVNPAPALNIGLRLDLQQVLGHSLIACNMSRIVEAPAQAEGSTRLLVCTRSATFYAVNLNTGKI